MSRRRKRKSLEGSKWRRRGPIEDQILAKIAALDKMEIGAVARSFITSLMLNGSGNAISVRQQWYLAFIASKTKAEFTVQETDWINDKISQECPEGFGERTQIGYKRTQNALSGVEPTQVTNPILLGSQRKIRT